MGNDTKAAALVFDQIRSCERLVPAQLVKMTMEEFEAIAKKVAARFDGAESAHQGTPELDLGFID